MFPRREGFMLPRRCLVRLTYTGGTLPSPTLISDYQNSIVCGLENCSAKNLPETIVVIAKHTYPGIDAKRLGKILDVREIMLECIDDDMSEVLELEFVMDFFGAQEQENLKKQVHDCKADEEARKTFVQQKAEWKASGVCFVLEKTWLLKGCGLPSTL